MSLPPPPPHQPSQPPQQPDQQPPGYLRLHLQGNVMVSMITPSVTIDGYPVNVSYGENTIPVHPGQHLLAAQAQWMWTYGQAQHPFAVGPGEVADLWYAPPALTFMKGAMGPQKQSIPGLVALFGILGGLVLLILLMVVLLAFLA